MDCGSAHRPVLPAEVAELLRPGGDELIVDGTVGLAGHAEMLLAKAGKDARLIGIDLDSANLRQARRRLAPFGERVRLFEANFADVDDVLAAANESHADVLLADLGVASTQLDDPRRGFSFQVDGPLDMRMGPAAETTAAELVNTLDASDLADLIYTLGEERYSRRIARAIVAARETGRIERTVQLADVIVGAMPAAVRRRRRGVHPATRTFQALRIAVNDELGSLETLLAKLSVVLAHGARAGIISFHSLEDRRVKQAFAALARSGQADVLTKKPITAKAEEAHDNPRSRSAKLRGIRWIARNTGHGDTGS